MKIGYIITSNIAYEKPLNLLIDSIEVAGMNKSHFLIYTNGHDRRHAKLTRGIINICVDHDSFDYTSMIELLEIEKEIKAIGISHFFFIQDTMQIGLKTSVLIEQANSDVDCTAAFGWMCNLILYRYDYLLENKDFIRSMRNCSKLKSIEYEGELYKRSDNRAQFENANCIEIGISHPYSDTPRLREYYPSVDITKWKSCWGQNMENLVIVP